MYAIRSYYVPDRAASIRTIVVELERLHSHFLSLALLAHALHDGQHFLRIMRERETLIGLLERVSGNRVHYGVNAIGRLPERPAARCIRRGFFWTVGNVITSYSIHYTKLYEPLRFSEGSIFS